MTLDDWLAPLSPTERRVMDQAVFGGSIREIANVLYVADTTVKFHLAAIFRKLSVGTRTELIALYWQHRLRDTQAASA